VCLLWKIERRSAGCICQTGNAGRLHFPRAALAGSQITPSASMASATRMKPAMFAPTT
jgi:hypothetical protein